MLALLGALIIVIFAAALSFSLRKPIEDTFFGAFGVVSFVLYGFGLCGKLGLGVWAVCGIALLLCVLVGAFIFVPREKGCRRENLSRFKECVLTPGLAVFAFLAVFFALLNLGREYYLNDEFSHWGLAIKNMFAVKELGVSAEASTTFKDYPPFATLVAYFWPALTGEFNESLTFTAMGLLMFSCLMPVFGRFSFKEKRGLWLLPAVLCGCFVTVMAFKLSAFTILAVDTLLGLVPVYIFGVYYLSKQSEKGTAWQDYILILIASASMPLIKSTGFAIGIFVCVIIIADAFFIAPKKCVKWLSLTPFLSMLLANMSWSAVVSANGLSEESVGYIERMKRLYVAIFERDKLLLWQQNTVDNFFNAFVEGRFSGGIPLVAILGVLVILSGFLVWAVWKNKVKRARYILLFSGLWVSFVLYISGVLYTFLHIFTPYEGENLASFERYTGTFLTLWLCLLFFLYFIEFYDVILAKLGAVTATVSCALLAAVITFFFTVYPYSAAKSRGFRVEYSKSEVIGELVGHLSELGIEETPKNVRICYVSEELSNSEKLIANYNAAPFVLEFSAAMPENLSDFNFVFTETDGKLYVVQNNELKIV